MSLTLLSLRTTASFTPTQQNLRLSPSTSAALRCKASSEDSARDLMELPINVIRRPLGRTRSNDQEKVQALMDSIQEIGLKEPIDVLDVDGKYYGFSGCHRYEAFQKLGIENIPCKVRKANQNTLKMHMM